MSTMAPALLLVALALPALGAGAPPGPARGDAAPPIALEASFQAPPPGEISWKALRGHVTVLEFWATW